MCDYQSERHCSKTAAYKPTLGKGAITSQNGTAPKLLSLSALLLLSAITSQNGTAPKRDITSSLGDLRAITSQNGTAPKH